MINGILIKKTSIFYKCLLYIYNLLSCLVMAVEVARLKVYNEDQDWKKKLKY